ncbi:MAG: ABC transporter permease [Bryobacteraceae bacterium]
MSSIRFFETIWQDLRYALRAMRKSPAFTLTAVLTLALGIGGNTAMFTIIRVVLLKPLDYRDPDRLVRVSADYPKRNLSNSSFTNAVFEQTRAASRSFSGLGAYLLSPESMILSGAGEPEALKAARVSGNFLNILGVRPVVGRGFRSGEDKPGGPAVAMISSELWQRRLGGDSKVSGKVVTLDATPYTIIGVLPQGFQFPVSGVDVWVTRPAEWSALPPRVWNIVPYLAGFARLKPGVSIEQARSEMNVLSSQFATPGFGNSAPRLRIEWLKDQLVQNLRLTLWILFGAVGFVLLIACANVASLLLARSSSRSREFAVRTAVGATRARLIRQLLAESVALSLMGGLFGVLLAEWTLRAVPHISALNLPGIGQIRADSTVLGFTIAVSIATGVLFGLFPSLQISRPDLADELRESGTMAGRGSPARSVFLLSARGLLVAAQIALSIVLLIGAALLMKSFARLRNVDPGFNAANLLTAKIALPPVRYDTGLKKKAFFDELTQRVGTAPGVRGAAAAMSIPTTSWIRTNIQIEGHPWEQDPNEWPSVQLQSITPTYFRTLEIPLRRGREFTARDNTPGAPPAIIVNESFARRFWSSYPNGQNPVGQYMREGADKTGWVEIVGIVADVREGGLATDAGPEFYVPSAMHPPQTAYLVVRTQGNALRFVSLVRKQVMAIDPDQPVSDVKTMENVLDATLGQRRLTMTLLGSFAAVAVLLAVVGIYGVIAYSVAQRTHEVGIRRALGAQQSDILRLVLGHAFNLALAGISIGIAGAFALTRIMKNLLFHVSATDPVTFAGIALLFATVALIASYIPARRALRIDPMTALRVG